MCMMLVLALLGHILNKIETKNETHAYGIENFLKSEMKKKRHSF